MPKLKSIVGETRTMNNGLRATCIRYVQWNDIDVQFEDGVIVQHKAKNNFYKGVIAHPSINARTTKTSCLGETRIMKNGQAAKCIEYLDSRHITVQFEDGTIVKNKTKYEFLRCTIGNPTIGSRTTSRRPLLGMKLVMNCGLVAEVIADRGASDIDVQFEDGLVVQHRYRADFKRRQISHPFYATRSFPQQLVLASVRQYFPDAIADFRPTFLKNQKSGHNLEIDVWIPSLCVGVEYDGYPWHKKETPQSLAKFETILDSDEIRALYCLVEKGCVKHESTKHHNYLLDVDPKTPSHEQRHLIEEIRLATTKLLKELGVSNPVLLYDEAFLDSIRTNLVDELVGEVRAMKNGHKAKLIVYRNSGDIDVQFEDGTIVRHRRIQNFREGEIKNPNFNKSSTVGMTVRMLNGLEATCIAYRSSKDLDVQFEDGTIVPSMQNQFP